MKKSLSIIFVLIGTLIGAGFASGKEIFVFFNKYGKLGLIGIIISGIVVSVVIYKVFKIIKSKDINIYSELINSLSKHRKINKFIEILINLFLIISFFIMVAGFSSYFHQQFNIPTLITSFVMAILCFITFKSNINGITKINTLLIPVLIIFIIFVTILNLNNFNNNFSYIEQISSNGILNNWIVSATLYASYNSIILIPILISLKKDINSKNIRKIPIITGIIFVVLGFCVYSLLTTGQNYISYIDLPIIFIIKEFGKIYTYLYGFVVVIAIFTSAISAGYGFLKSFEYSNRKYNVITIIICIIAIPVSLIRFSFLVEFLYPIFGILGLIQVILILYMKVLKK